MNPCPQGCVAPFLELGDCAGRVFDVGCAHSILVTPGSCSVAHAVGRAAKAAGDSRGIIAFNKRDAVVSVVLERAWPPRSVLGAGGGQPIHAWDFVARRPLGRGLAENVPKSADWHQWMGEDPVVVDFNTWW